ncbi:hypothetical protein P692DRAFT_20756930 [Suillus brevipes Sb2]|nr:hypothetical protein P692DRAFT_20756930 [Suillus brevipes Sb2]
MLIEVVVCRLQWVSLSILLRARATLIQVVACRLHVLILRQARAMLIKVVARRSQCLSKSFFTIIFFCLVDRIILAAGDGI